MELIRLGIRQVSAAQAVVERSQLMLLLRKTRPHPIDKRIAAGLAFRERAEFGVRLGGANAMNLQKGLGAWVDAMGAKR